MPNQSAFMTEPSLLTTARDTFNTLLHATAEQDSKTAILYYDLSRALSTNKNLVVPEFPVDTRDVVGDTDFWKALVKSGKIDLLLAPCNCTDYGKFDETATTAQVDDTHYLGRHLAGHPGVIKVNLPVMKITKNKTQLRCPACKLSVCASSPAEALLAYNRLTVESAAPDTFTTSTACCAAGATKDRVQEMPAKIACHFGKTVSVEQHLEGKKAKNKAADIQRKLQTRLRSLVLYCFDQVKVTPRWDAQNVFVLYREAGECYGIEVQHDAKTSTQHFSVFNNPINADYVANLHFGQMGMEAVKQQEAAKLSLQDGQAVLYYNMHYKTFDGKQKPYAESCRPWSDVIDITVGIKAHLIPAGPKIAEKETATKK